MRLYLEKGMRYDLRTINRKSHVRLQLAPRSMTFDDLELLKVPIFWEVYILRLSRAYLCVS